MATLPGLIAEYAARVNARYDAQRPYLDKDADAAVATFEEFDELRIYQAYAAERDLSDLLTELADLATS